MRGMLGIEYLSFSEFFNFSSTLFSPSHFHLFHTSFNSKFLHSSHLLCLSCFPCLLLYFSSMICPFLGLWFRFSFAF